MSAEKKDQHRRTSGGAGKKRSPERTTRSGKTEKASRHRSPKKNQQRSKTVSGHHPSGSNMFRWLFGGIVLVCLILAVTLIVLDKKALEHGETGLWETLTGQTPAGTSTDVDNRFRKVLAGFGLTKSNVYMEGTVPGRGKNRLFLRAFDAPDRSTWLKIGKRFEAACEKAGIKVYNRSFSKTETEWKLSFYLGTPSRRTHKIDIRYRLKHQPPPPTPTHSPPPPPTRAPTPSGPVIALVFDDFGADMTIAIDFLDRLHVPITLAVMPYLKHTTDIIKLVRRRGQTAFLHLPMEPENTAAMGRNRSDFLTTTMSHAEILRRLQKLLDSLPPIDGVNNHMGSKLTADPERMRVILSELKRRGIPFLDSRTSPKTVAAAVAREIHLPHASRAVFLDQGYKGGDVAANLQELIKTAREKGAAVGIGHAQPATLAVLEKEIPIVLKQGVRVVPVTSLMSAD